MLALLKLIPLRDWVYIGAIIVLLSAFGWYTVHERRIGEQKIEAADAKVAAAEIVKNAALQQAAHAEINSIGEIYVKAIHLPPPASLGIVCHAPSGSQLPEAAGNRPGNSSTAPRPSGSDFDPSGPAIAVGRNADAQINALIDTITALRKEMGASP